MAAAVDATKCAEGMIGSDVSAPDISLFTRFCGRLEHIHHVSQKPLSRRVFPLTVPGAKHSFMVKQLRTACGHEVAVAKEAGELGIGPKVLYDYAYSVDGDTHAFFVTRWYAQDVFAYMTSEAGDPLGERIRMMGQLALSVARLHDTMKIAHRDVKWENALMGADKSVLLIDFESATPLRGAKRAFTPIYAAPEIFVAEKLVPPHMDVPTGCVDVHDERPTDVFALGVLFFEAVTTCTLIEEAAEKRSLVEECTRVYEVVSSDEAIAKRVHSVFTEVGFTGKVCTKLEAIVLGATCVNPCKRVPARVFAAQIEELVALLDT